MSKKGIIEILKWCFAAGILYYLARSGRLSFQEVTGFFAEPVYALGSIALLVVILFIAFYRWQILLKAVGIEVPYKTVFKLGMLGQFFSTVLPGGSVGGDLVKAVYIARRFPQAKLKTISTVFMDRVMGLAGMILLGMLCFLLTFKNLSELPQSQSSLILNLGYLISVLGALIVLGMILFPFLTRRFPLQLPARFAHWPAHGFIKNLYDAGITYRNEASALWLTLAISIFCQVVNVGVFYVIAYQLNGTPPWGHINFYSFVLASILGLISMALPIAPAGLGIGQIAFAATFVSIGAPQANFGVNLVTCFLIISILVNLSGAVFFATYKHETQEKSPSLQT